MPFGQVVVGPPGCGKTTYCYGLSQVYTAIERPYIIINLDPANDGVPYKADIDISELITLQDAMDEYSLGPNGGLIFCMEYLETNIDWLFERLEQHKDEYFIFDIPGQVELFTNHNSLKNIIIALQKKDYRLCVTHLVDSHYCVDPSKYVSMLMVSLKTMLQLECPQVNVLSKIDLIESYGKLDFNLDFYTQVQDLSYLLERLDLDPFTAKYKKLNAALCELVEEFGLVGYFTLCVQDKESMMHIIRAVDKANGYIFGGLEKGNESIFETADRWDMWDRYAQEVAEKYLNKEDDDIDFEEAKETLLGEIREKEQ
ncbi:GPN-loop GTPase 2 [Terramyces sp. JEL0728]|nr:GPN-loop GTPase 2 [Terramyces sp. JEL0728]